VSLVENKVVWRLVEEVYNESNLDVVDELMAPAVFYHAAVPNISTASRGHSSRDLTAPALFKRRSAKYYWEGMWTTSLGSAKATDSLNHLRLGPSKTCQKVSMVEDGRFGVVASMSAYQ
jgi:hypothetical protein